MKKESKEETLENKENHSKLYNNKKIDIKESSNNNMKDEKSKKKEMKDNKSNIIKKIDKRKIVSSNNNTKKLVKSDNDIYGQDQNSIEYMKECAPKMPDLFNHEYNIYSKDCLLKKNETSSVLKKGIIPNVFYNHLMININNKITNNKCKYISNSITQKNKKKLITIIYYAPKQ